MLRDLIAFSLPVYLRFSHSKQFWFEHFEQFVQLSPGTQMYFCCGYHCHMCKSASSSRLFRYFLCKDIVMCAKTFHHKIFCRVQKSSTQGVTSAMCNCPFILRSSELTTSHQRSSAQNLKTSCVVLKSHRLLP